MNEYTELLPNGYEIKMIDATIYDRCFEHPQTRDFVSSFLNKEDFLAKGLGVVILKDGRIVACAYLILECLKRELYPSWDAQNMNSVGLAQKLGYEYSHQYTAFEVI